MVCKDWEKGKKVFIIVCLVIVVIMVALGVISIILKPANPATIPNEQERGELDFSGPEYKPSELYDESNKEISLADFSNEPMVLVFFNTKIEESLDVLRMLKENEEAYLGKVNIVGIYVPNEISEDVSKVKQELTENNISLSNILFDLDYSANNEYGVTLLPTVVCINKNSEIINTITSNINEDVINANLDILAENY